MKRIQLKVDNNGRTEAINDGKVFIASTIQVGATDKDLTIDICFTSKDSEGEIALGIFKIEEDTLTICRSKPRQLRPTEFSSKPGTGHTLMSYQKQRSTAK